MKGFVALAALVHLGAIYGFTKQLGPVLFAATPLVLASVAVVRARPRPHPLLVFLGMTVTSGVAVGVWLLWRAGE